MERPKWNLSSGRNTKSIGKACNYHTKGSSCSSKKGVSVSFPAFKARKQSFALSNGMRKKSSDRHKLSTTIGRDKQKNLLQSLGPKIENGRKGSKVKEECSEIEEMHYDELYRPNMNALSGKKGLFPNKRKAFSYIVPKTSLSKENNYKLTKKEGKLDNKVQSNVSKQRKFPIKEFKKVRRPESRVVGKKNTLLSYIAKAKSNTSEGEYEEEEEVYPQNTSEDVIVVCDNLPEVTDKVKSYTRNRDLESKEKVEVLRRNFAFEDVSVTSPFTEHTNRMPSGKGKYLNKKRGELGVQKMINEERQLAVVGSESSTMRPDGKFDSCCSNCLRSIKWPDGPDNGSRSHVEQELSISRLGFQSKVEGFTNLSDVKLVLTRRAKMEGEPVSLVGYYRDQCGRVKPVELGVKEYETRTTIVGNLITRDVDGIVGDPKSSRLRKEPHQSAPSRTAIQCKCRSMKSMHKSDLGFK